VQDGVDSAVHSESITDVAYQKRNRGSLRGGHIATATRREVIDRDDFITPEEQLVAEVRAQKTAPPATTALTGDQCRCSRIPCCEALGIEQIPRIDDAGVIHEVGDLLEVQPAELVHSVSNATTAAPRQAS